MRTALPGITPSATSSCTNRARRAERSAGVAGVPAALLLLPYPYPFLLFGARRRATLCPPISSSPCPHPPHYYVSFQQLALELRILKVISRSLQRHQQVSLKAGYGLVCLGSMGWYVEEGMSGRALASVCGGGDMWRRRYVQEAVPRPLSPPHDRQLQSPART